MTFADLSAKSLASTLVHDQEAKVVKIPKGIQKKFGAGTILIPGADDVISLIRKIPIGKLITQTGICAQLAKRYRADVTCPMTTGSFVRVAAHAADKERRRGRRRDVPYWRVIREDGTLFNTFPGGIIEQSIRLLKEGHTLELGKKRGNARIKGFRKRLHRF